MKLFQTTYINKRGRQTTRQQTNTVEQFPPFHLHSADTTHTSSEGLRTASIPPPGPELWLLLSAPHSATARPSDMLTSCGQRHPRRRFGGYPACPPRRAAPPATAYWGPAHSHHTWASAATLRPQQPHCHRRHCQLRAPLYLWRRRRTLVGLQGSAVGRTGLLLPAGCGGGGSAPAAACSPSACCCSCGEGVWGLGARVALQVAAAMGAAAELNRGQMTRIPTIGTHNQRTVVVLPTQRAARTGAKVSRGRAVSAATPPNSDSAPDGVGAAVPSARDTLIHQHHHANACKRK